ncbi:cytochrome aa3 quinol oxidase subunit III [Rummeliibacillus sp. G93]|uniref:Quinol oxidase subunit 3 n=1 Tax=Rummeliibacillus stabekisii TaxID=241244 RepID=A0A143HA70_9BACL|nr:MULTISPECIES: cytochrome aa3 quinol oxidase subunit III [Rummeliibacillus]AMW98290.1 cytochrome o ubiquinol oxidase subunit III [Rummeliibacillus stabekisii]MBB5170020.1 cytochrome aa3-600 menaquinol oxidase subunit 3 [Rummeliibacillus stabekisii]MCM3315677.1 cytochrome aa3 quinol oxidase subunit III [Rummeliibacillus stabekisii]UQW98250.1 cytochrome aa3 quinol oxidase subunit III [Rummeliibacillus sp. G93]GEL04278.1 cytochrome aa3 quinol oxidase subunit III [Rummeliibacillus stabekisii]
MSKENTSAPLEYRTHENEMKIFGFWVFLGAEIVLFATLFSVYFALADRTGTGPTGKEIFEMPPVLIETFVLLTSSFLIGLGVHAMRIGRKKAMMVFYIITLLLGLVFLGVEINEFLTYIHDGATITTSAFMSALMTLLGTHGAHVTFGFLWGSAILIQIKRHGLNAKTANKAFIFSLYWHFLDVVWIFIFSFVYLKGVL